MRDGQKRDGRTPPGEPPAVALDGVRFRWPGQEHDVLAIDALVIERGERVFVRGASGSGKSTLLSLIGAVSVPREGRIRVDGVDLDTLRGGARDTFRAERIGFVFQMFNLLPFLGLVDNVLLPCRFSTRRAERAVAGGRTLEAEARRLLAALGLDVEALARRPVVELSVGQQQRVAAARALIGSPPIVVADEPTSALDADARHGFLELLFTEVRAVGATLVFVSHDRGLEDAFDRVVELAHVNAATAVDTTTGGAGPSGGASSASASPTGTSSTDMPSGVTSSADTSLADTLSGGVSSDDASSAGAPSSDAPSSDAPSSGASSSGASSSGRSPAGTPPPGRMS